MKIANAKIDGYVKGIGEEKIAGALIFGASASVAMSRFNAIAKKITPDLQDQFLVANLTKERFAAEKSCLADEFYSFSMFGGRKLIIIRGDACGAALHGLKALLKDADEVKKSDNFILILAGDLDRGSALRKLCENDENIAALPCYEDSEAILKKLIAQCLKRGGIEANFDVQRHLLEILPNNRQIIAAEIEKLAVFVGGGEVSVADVDRVIANQNEVGFDELSDAFVVKNKKKAVLAAQNLFKNGFEPVMAVRFLANYLLKLYNAKVEIERGGSGFDEAVRGQRLFFKAENAFKKHLRAVKLADLVAWLDSMQELEVELKSTGLLGMRERFLGFLLV